MGPPNTPLETLESVEMVEATCPAKRPAFEGRWFFCGLVVDATTRSDTTRRWGQTTDLSARLADSASRPNGQLTRAGQFYHSITGRCPWRCDSCGTSIAGREPASESRQPSPSVARPSQSLQPRGRPAAQASCPSQSLQPPRPLTVAAAPDALSSP